MFRLAVVVDDDPDITLAARLALRDMFDRVETLNSPADLLALVDVRRFGPGERVVDALYTRDMFERTQGWLREWDLLESDGAVRYEEAVLS